MSESPPNLLRPLRSASTRLLDIVLPPRCLACGTFVERQGTICGDCWGKLDFITSPLCERCGLPFEVEALAGSICGGCSADTPPFRRHRSVWRYGDASKALILGFKHGDQVHAAGALADHLARTGSALLDEADFLIPVPLHKWRLLRRRFNQSAVLAHALAGRTGITVLPDALKRMKATRSMGGLSNEQRRRNVAGAFVLNARYRARLQGASLILIDDVYTTGATLKACTRVLTNAGAGAVDALSLARVV